MRSPLPSACQDPNRFRTVGRFSGRPGLNSYLVSRGGDGDHRQVLSLCPGPAFELEEWAARRAGLHHPLLPPIRGYAFRGSRPGLVTDVPTFPKLDLFACAWDLERRIVLGRQLVDLVRILHHRGLVTGALGPWLLLGRGTCLHQLDLVWPSRPITGRTPEPGVSLYSAPESTSGESSEAADRYSLGLLLYHVFTGSPPFAEDLALQLPTLHSTVEPRRPRSLAPDLPPAVERAILGLSRKLPERRLSLDTAAELLSAAHGRNIALPAPKPHVHLVGRDHEIARFRALLDRWIQAPEPALIALTGPPGSGRRAMLRRLELICSFRGIPTVRLDPENGETTSETGRTGDLPPMTRPAVILAPSGQASLEDSVARCCRILASGQPALQILTAECGDDHPTWLELRRHDSRGCRLHRIDLGPLSTPNTAELIRQALAPDSPQRLREVLQHRSGGCPGYVITQIEELVERGSLSYGSGCWQWKEDRALTSGKMIPGEVACSIGTRLAALPRSARTIFEFLTLIRRTTEVSELSQLAEMQSEEAEAAVRLLEGAGLAFTGGSLAQPTCSLAGPWLPDAAEECLDPETRRQRVQRILAVWPPERLTPVEVVRFASRAKDRIQLQLRLYEDLDRLLAGNRFGEAIDLLRGALEREVIHPGDWPVLKRMVEATLQAGNLESCLETIKSSLGQIMNKDQRAFLLWIQARALLARGAFVRSAATLRQAYPLAHADSELQTNILAELLAALSGIGVTVSARRVALKVFRLLRSKTSLALRDRLFHAVYRFTVSTSSPLSTATLTWEAKSLRTAARTGNIPVHRVCLVTKHLLSAGCWDRGLRLSRWLQREVAELQSPKLEVWSLLARGQEARKRGRHREACRMLEDALVRAGWLDWGPELEFDLRLELARNSCHQLAIDATIRQLKLLDNLLERSCHEGDILDLTLLKGWLQLQLGKAQPTLVLIEGLLECGLLKDPRVHLLLGSALLLEGHFNLARSAVADAAKAAGDLEWYIARCRLLRAEIALAEGKFREAGAMSRSVLRLCQAKPTEPLQAKAQLIKARQCLALDRLTEARGRALRAHQLLRSVDRLGLHADVNRTLAEIAGRLGDSAAAFDWVNRVLDPLEEQAARLSNSIRQGFVGRHLAPLDALRRDLGWTSHDNVSARGSLTRFAARIRSAGAWAGGLREAAECLAAKTQACAFAVFTRHPESGKFRLEHGKGRLSNPPILSGQEPQEEGISGSISRKGCLTVVDIPFRSSDRIEAWVHLEVPGCLSESTAELLLTALSLSDACTVPSAKGTDPSRRLPSAASSNTPEFVGQHPVVLRMLEEVRRFARSDGTVLLTGETGTGKEVLARMIHNQSPRRHGPFVPVNCAALPADLVESELFGHAQGSFTGAHRAKPGLFETAAHGTIFLDEISAMPLALQPRLLRVLQEKRSRRLGENREHSVDVRVVAATNLDLHRLVQSGQFREDLYHRLHVLTVTLPPLRERASDLPLLVQHFVSRLRERVSAEVTVSPGALQAMGSYPFPGNVRQLENLLESLALCAVDGVITKDAVRRKLADAPGGIPASTCRQTERLLAALLQGTVDFWTAVRDPFLNRDLSRHQVRDVVAQLLATAGGSYLQVSRDLGMAPRDYKKLMNFLSQHDCRVDFRPFRKKNGTCA